MRKILNYENIKLNRARVAERVSIPVIFNTFAVPNIAKYTTPANKHLNKNLENGKTLCPFHSDVAPSFSYNKKGNYFMCFACSGTKSTGDSVILYKELMDEIGRTISMVGALTELGELYNIPLEKMEIELEDEVDLGSVLKDFETKRNNTSAELYKTFVEEKKRYVTMRDIDNLMVNATSKAEIMTLTYILDILASTEVALTREEVLTLLKSYKKEGSNE